MTTDYLLTCLSEECAEVIKPASKAIRFGKDSKHPSRGEGTNAENIMDEFYDICAVIEMLQERGTLPYYSRTKIKKLKIDKREKVERLYNEFSQKLKERAYI